MALLNKPQKVFLRRKQVEEMTGFSRSTIYAKFNQNPKRPKDYDPTFPKPRKIGERAVRWLESEVENWMDMQAESTAGTKKGATS